MNINIHGISIALSDVLSIASMLGVLFMFCFFQWKMNRQQIHINKDTIEKSKKEKEEDLKGDICAYREKETKSLVLLNRGRGIATNIRIQYNNLTQENGFFVVDKRKNPYPILNPGDIFKIHLELCAQVKDIPIITLIWDDNFGTDRKKEQAIDL